MNAQAVNGQLGIDDGIQGVREIMRRESSCLVEVGERSEVEENKIDVVGCSSTQDAS